MTAVVKRPTGLLLWLRAETFIHVGAGQQSSLIDLPFAREGATGYPYIPGSGMKGALRDAARVALGYSANHDPTVGLFGERDQAGRILVSDARLAFLPVRSLSASYRYVTSVDLLNRLARDITFAMGAKTSWGGNAALLAGSGGDGKALFKGSANAKVFLEEFAFGRVDQPKLDGALLPGLPPDTTDEVQTRGIVLSHGEFDYFARHGLHVRTRNKLDEETKTVEGGGLWSEESLPPDTLMYVVLMPRLAANDNDLLGFCNMLEQSAAGYFQVGGNETVGEGWFEVLNLPAAPGGS